MTKKKMLWIALPLVAVLGVGVAGAGYKHYGGHHNPERMVERISDKLDLNAEQEAKLDAVKVAIMQSREEWQQEKVATMDEIIVEVRKPEMDQASIIALIDARKSRFDLMAPQVIEPLIEFHKSLNDQQRGKIVNLLEAVRDWGWGHGHKRRG